MKIPFNKPYFSGSEGDRLIEAANSGKISGNGKFTKLCHDFFTEKYGFKKVLLTTSCTDALEMAAILLDIKKGDEVICPSFAFVSTANAFVLRGAKMVFADSSERSPNIDADKLENLITPRTKAIVIIHYAGFACDMKNIMEIAERHNIFVVEDAAQAIDSFYFNKPLGSFGHLAAFSFHETKNIISGEGGLLVINDERFLKRAEIIWEKGTNRAAFFRGEVDKYSWVDIGSSFLPSELIAAFLYAQLEHLDRIQAKRLEIWNYYYLNLKALEDRSIIKLQEIEEGTTNNAHLFYILTRDTNEQELLLKYLSDNGIQAVFHYLPLHKSPYYISKHDGRMLGNAERYSETIVRLPFFYEIARVEQDYIIGKIRKFYKQ